MAQRTRRVDVVTVLVNRNPNTGVRFISNFSVIGSSFPCTGLLVRGRRFVPLRNCLLRNGFVLITAVDGLFVFVRVRFV